VKRIICILSLIFSFSAMAQNGERSVSKKCDASVVTARARNLAQAFADKKTVTFISTKAEVIDETAVFTSTYSFEGVRGLETWTFIFDRACKFIVSQNF